MEQAGRKTLAWQSEDITTMIFPGSKDTEYHTLELSQAHRMMVIIAGYSIQLAAAR